MRFVFDVDGVITEMPELFSALTVALKASGHEIFIVTDFDESYRQFRENELKEIGIVYDELVISSKKETFFNTNKIDYAFDDDPEYYTHLKKLGLFAFSRK